MRKTIAALIVLFFALIGAPAWRELSVARNRALQKRTMADMRNLAMGMEAYASDRNVFPAPQSISFATMRRVPFEELDRALRPKYLISAPPRRDHWGNPLEVRVGAYDAKTRTQRFAVRSTGKDGRAEGETYKHGQTSGFNADIVFADGNFLRYPEGI